MKDKLTGVSARFAAVALGGLIAMATPAAATTVQYSTTGTFSTTGTNSLTGTNGETLIFNAVPGFSSPGVNTTPAVDSLGYFMVTNTTGGTLTPPPGETFTLSLNQVAPSGSGGFTSSAFGGTLSDPTGAPSGGLTLTLSQTSFTVGGNSYQVQNLNNGNQLSIGTGLTNVQAAITSSAPAAPSPSVPEPMSMSLLGGGLAFIGLARWRRKAGK
jgi:hypothetical protein